MADNFEWYELRTSDVEAAKSFYGTVIGWNASPSEVEGSLSYQIMSMKGKKIAGMIPLANGLTASSWLGYIGVSDCATAVQKAVAAGATHRCSSDIGVVGVAAALKDPQGVEYGNIQRHADMESHAFMQGHPGHGSWSELFTTDIAAASDYYPAQFGWTEGRTFPMGPAGDYKLFQVDGADVVGMMNGTPGEQPSWLFYFGTPDIDETVEKIGGNGGVIQHGPTEVPGGAWIVQARDPQGAAFAMIGPRK